MGRAGSGVPARLEDRPRQLCCGPASPSVDG
jgi:hypothetical protein